MWKCVMKREEGEEGGSDMGRGECERKKIDKRR